MTLKKRFGQKKRLISLWNSKFQIAVKKEMLKPETWNCSYAAPPDDIHWENLTNSRVMWYLKSGFIHGLLLILVIFLTTPKHAAEHFDDFLHLTLGKNVRKSIMPCPFTSLWPGTKTWTSPKHFGTCKRTRH